MPAIIKNGYRQHQAREFVESLSEGSPDDNFYLVIAKNNAWSGATEAFYNESAPNDSTAPTPNDSAMSESFMWDNFIAAKKITGSDVSLVVKRINHWSDIPGGTAVSYQQYDPTRDDLADDDFFVVKNDGANTNVYKVINNLGTRQTQTITTDAALITGNIITIAVNGVVITETFATSNDATLAAFAAKIQAEPSVFTATVTSVGGDATDDRVIVVVSARGGTEQTNLTLTAVTGGATQAGVVTAITVSGTTVNTNAPSGQLTTGVSAGADFYKWKYMYSITAAQFEKFVTDSWIPIQTLTADGGSLQWDVQTNAVAGDINNFRIDNPGTGYTVGAIVTVSGGVTPFAGTVAAVGGSGEIQRFTITNAGAGYRVPQASNVSVTVGSGAVLTPMVSPPGGHGKDAEKELGGFFVMINVKLQDDEGTAFPIGDDYRIIGILKNPLNDAGAKVSTTYIDLIGTAPATTKVGVAAGNVAVDSGSFIYTEFRNPIFRNATQTEDLKIIVRF